MRYKQHDCPSRNEYISHRYKELLYTIGDEYHVYTILRTRNNRASTLATKTTRNSQEQGTSTYSKKQPGTSDQQLKQEIARNKGLAITARNSQEQVTSNYSKKQPGTRNQKATKARNNKSMFQHQQQILQVTMHQLEK